MNNTNESNGHKSIPRDDRGRVKVGNQLGLNNRGQAARKDLRLALLGADTDSNIKAIGAKLVAMALEGDVAAARLWLDHVLGRPRVAVEISGPGGSPLSLGMILMAIREATPDPAMQEQIADRLQHLLTSQQSLALPAPDGHSD